MMTIADMEKTIIERLKDRISGVEVIAFPEKPAEYKLLHHKGAILVSYRGSSFSEPRATDVVVQERKVELDIVVVMRHLRSHEGAYAYLDAVRTILTGFRLPGCSKMYPLREEFISEEGGIWQYAITFAFTMPAIELVEEEQVVLLKKITVMDDYGITEVLR